MGKRKERRLAAKTASNRRVKLDLLAEPSGDVGDSSNKQEVGDWENSKHDAESADSPTSSGQRAENPLLLLGQYSDEEVDEESGKETIHDSGEHSSVELDEQGKVESHNGTKTDEDENITTEKADKEKNDQSSSDILQKSEENNVIEDYKTESPQLHADAVDHPLVPYTSDTQTKGDTDSGWKMVLHEESNSYYYWNILTGQTSWEVPPALTTESAPEGVETQPNNGIANDIVFEDTDNDGFRAELEVNNNDVNTVTLENDNIIDGGNLLSNGVAQVDNSGIQDMSGHLYQGTVGDLCSDSSRLLEIGESLLERLKSLKGSEGFSEQISKLTFELDIRLADIKSLVPYGSSLLPFWLHSENQLKRLETSINNYSQFTKIGEINEPINRLTANEINPEFDPSVHVHENAIQPDIDPNGPHHSVEDEDMDVEMEVEDAKISIVDESGQHNGPQLDQSIHNVPQLDQSIHESRLPEEEYNFPQPPNDEWVPPPPPDDEPLPPPPPDEPPEAAVPPPPAEIQSAQPYFGEQYSYTYPGSTYEYYGQSQTNTELPSNSYYVDANGCQVAAPLPTLYYANPYPDGDPVMNTGQPVTYYVQNGPVSTAPVVGSVETESSTHKVPKESVTKVQPKVSRNKKRTVASVPTLRSNKKVSGLVDKWKAVKEELHDDEEDEPENALEVLEKKRQREIEQWHAQQIATGEAKDNANFQPLGGDWRERVRRKRAKKSTETKENVSKSTDDPNQQPDLAELSKQLPPGWQAYWDEASKQVYYGNSKTSETTWVKPSN